MARDTFSVSRITPAELANLKRGATLSSIQASQLINTMLNLAQQKESPYLTVDMYWREFNRENVCVMFNFQWLSEGGKKEEERNAEFPIFVPKGISKEEWGDLLVEETGSLLMITLINQNLLSHYEALEFIKSGSISFRGVV